MATTVQVDWTVTIRTPDGFALIHDIEVTAEVTLFSDGDWAVGRFFIEGSKGETLATMDRKRIEFDAMSGEPHGLWGMVVAELQADEKLGEAAFEQAAIDGTIRYVGKGPNDPDGFFKLEAAE